MSKKVQKSSTAKTRQAGQSTNSTMSLKNFATIVHKESGNVTSLTNVQTILKSIENALLESFKDPNNKAIRLGCLVLERKLQKARKFISIANSKLKTGDKKVYTTSKERIKLAARISQCFNKKIAEEINVSIAK